MKYGITKLEKGNICSLQKTEDPVEIILKKIDSVGIFLHRIVLWIKNSIHLIKLWLKNNIGVPEILTGLRHLLINLQSWPLSLFLIKHFSKYETAMILFFCSVLVSCVFLKISDHFKGDWFKIEGIKNGEEIKKKTFLIRILLRFTKRKTRSRVSLFLFFVEPFILVLYYRDGHHRYNGIPTLKVWSFFLLSSAFASILWTTLMVILTHFGVPYFLLSGIIVLALISLIYFIRS